MSWSLKFSLFVAVLAEIYRVWRESRSIPRMVRDGTDRHGHAQSHHPVTTGIDQPRA